MRSISIMFFWVFMLCGCAAFNAPVHTGPDPRALAAAPSMNTIPVAPLVDGVYALPGTGLNHIIMLFPGGTIQDPRGKEGAVQLLCALMTTGGTQGLSPYQVQDTLGDLAVSIAIAPQREYTRVVMTFLPDVTEKAMGLLHDILVAPRLDPARLEIERKVYIDSVIRDQEEAMTVAFDAYRAHFYRGDPRAYNATPQSLRAITREDLARLHQSLFTKKPLLGVVGQVEAPYTRTLLDALSGTWSANPVGYPEKTEFGQFNLTATEKQCVLLRAHAAPDMLSAGYAASVVADHIIGSGGFGSLMVKEVRTRKGLAYATQSFYQARPRWGVFGMYVITESKDLAEVREALERVAGEIRRDISDADVAMAKQAVINSYAVGYNTPGSIISHTMDTVFYGIPQNYDADFLARVNALSAKEVRAAALQLISGPWVEVVVNPPVVQ